MAVKREDSLDRNKSALTHRATATAAAWLDGIGCKPVETEVALGGWVADLASFWTPTCTEAKRARLLRDICPDIKDHTSSFEWLTRRYPSRLTLVMEVKVTRSDFLADSGRKYRVIGPERDTRRLLIPPAHLCVLATTAEAMGKDRLADWGVLKLSADGSRVVKWESPWHINAQHPYQVEDLIAAVAIRRDHATRYAGARRFWKSYRAELSQDKARRLLHKNLHESNSSV